MSVIFDAMLILELGDQEAIEALNKALYFADTERHQQFGKVDFDRAGAGGSKTFTTTVYAAAFNHFTPTDVEGCIRAAPWRYPECVLYVRDLGDYHYDEPSGLSSQTVAELRAAVATRVR